MNVNIIVSIAIIVLMTISIIRAHYMKRGTRRHVNISEEVNISAPDVLECSIIISARNERSNIKNLVASLSKLDFPKEKFEVIIVDDNSSDGTLDELNSAVSEMINLKIIELKPTGLRGKRDALTFGIQHSQYPFILITDADCHPESGWLEAYAAMFQSGYEVVYGIAPFYQRNKLPNMVACFNNLMGSFLSFTMASLGLPYTAAARNFGFTKKTFEKLGGYSNTRETISGDDDLLLREAVKNKMRIGVITSQGSFVYSESKKSFKEYLQQKARQTQTSFHYLIKHRFILSFWHLLNLFFLFSPLLIVFSPLFGILLPAKLLIDLITVKSTQKKFGYNFSFMQIIYLQIFYEILLIVHFINARFSEIKWK